MECYLDNSATTRVNPQVIDLMNTLFDKEYGNPSSLHKKGFTAEKYLRSSREILAGILLASPENILFTSGGTESNNMAILGTALRHSHTKRHMITTVIEHPSVSAPMKFLESRGFRITRLGVDKDGIIDLQELEEALEEETILVSIMHVNNETGSVEPVKEAGELIRRKAPSCLFHVDDIQGFGKLPLIPRSCGIDFLSASSHKLHGPKGTGLLYRSERASFSPIVFGGGQMDGMRSGTENVPGIAGFARAAKLICQDLEDHVSHVKAVKQRFLDGIASIGSAGGAGSTGGTAAPAPLQLNCSPEKTSPFIASVTAAGIRSEVLLHALEEKGIYISAGSACSSNKPRSSATLKAIGLTGDDLESTVRFSFSIHTTFEEIDYTIDTLRELIPSLSRFKRE